MASSLDPDLTPRRDRQLGIGHGTGALGPSDTSDSGSDVMGGAGFKDEDELDLGLQQGTTSDLHKAGGTAGPDLGDADLDSDTDAVGTGEHAEAGRDTGMRDGHDIDADQVQAIGDVPDIGDPDTGDVPDIGDPDLADVPDIEADDEDATDAGTGAGATRH